MNSGHTGGVCSSCLKEIPLVMVSSSASLYNPQSKLCSNCMTEVIDQQHFPSDVNNKFPPLLSSQTLLNDQKQKTQSLFHSSFSSLPSSSASSTSSSISSTNRRLSTFDPFTSGNVSQNSFLHPLIDVNNTFSPLITTNFKNDFELITSPPPPLATKATTTTTVPTATNDIMRFFPDYLNGNNHNSDRDSPTSSIQSNDFPQNLFPRPHSLISSSSLNHLSANGLPSSFCCFANNPLYTYCFECETPLCEKCALTHPKILGFKDHRQQLLTPQYQNTRSSVGQQSVVSNSGKFLIDN